MILCSIARSLLPALVVAVSWGLFSGCAGTDRGLRPPDLEPDALAKYEPAAVRRIALVAPKDFTPETLPELDIVEPFTGTLIRTLRDRCNLEVIPGYLPSGLEFVGEVRAWYQGMRRSRFPADRFKALTQSVKADAYLVAWIDRSARELATDEALQRVPAGEYRLHTSFVLLDPSGRVYWSVVDQESAQVGREGIGLAVKDAVEANMVHLVRGCKSEENWQLGVQ